MVKILVEKKDGGRECTIEMKGNNFELMGEATLGVMKLCEGMAKGNSIEMGALMYGIGQTLVDQANDICK